MQLLASLERLLLTPAWQTAPSVSGATIKHLLFLYSSTREIMTGRGVRWNARAERALVNLLDGRGALPAAAHELPFPVIAWIFQQERLRDFSANQIERWLIGAPNQEVEGSEERLGGLEIAARLLTQTREAPVHVLNIVERLTLGSMFEPMETLFRNLRAIAGRSADLGAALVRSGMIEKVSGNREKYTLSSP